MIWRRLWVISLAVPCACTAPLLLLGSRAASQTDHLFLPARVCTRLS
jgi:hypothetical protein